MGHSNEFIMKLITSILVVGIICISADRDVVNCNDICTAWVNKGRPNPGYSYQVVMDQIAKNGKPCIYDDACIYRVSTPGSRSIVPDIEEENPVTDDECTGIACDSNSTNGDCPVTTAGYEIHITLTPIVEIVSVSGSVQTQLDCVTGEQSIKDFKAAQETEIKEKINDLLNDASDDAVFKDSNAEIKTVKIKDPTCTDDEDINIIKAIVIRSRLRRGTSQKAAYDFDVEVEYDSVRTTQKASTLGEALKKHVEENLTGAEKVSYNSANLMKFGFALLAVVLLR